MRPKYRTQYEILFIHDDEYEKDDSYKIIHQFYLDKENEFKCYLVENKIFNKENNMYLMIFNMINTLEKTEDTQYFKKEIALPLFVNEFKAYFESIS